MICRREWASSSSGQVVQSVCVSVRVKSEAA